MINEAINEIIPIVTVCALISSVAAFAYNIIYFRPAEMEHLQKILAEQKAKRKRLDASHESLNRLSQLVTTSNNSRDSDYSKILQELDIMRANVDEISNLDSNIDQRKFSLVRKIILFVPILYINRQINYLKVELNETSAGFSKIREALMMAQKIKRVLTSNNYAEPIQV